MHPANGEVCWERAPDSNGAERHSIIHPGRLVDSGAERLADLSRYVEIPPNSQQGVGSRRILPPSGDWDSANPVGWSSEMRPLRTDPSSFRPPQVSRAGIKRRVHLHGLRHAHAVELARKGAPLHEVQAVEHRWPATAPQYPSARRRR